MATRQKLMDVCLQESVCFRVGSVTSLHLKLSLSGCQYEVAANTQWCGCTQVQSVVLLAKNGGQNGVRIAACRSHTHVHCVTHVAASYQMCKAVRDVCDMVSFLAFAVLVGGSCGCGMLCFGFSEVVAVQSPKPAL